MGIKYRSHAVSGLTRMAHLPHGRKGSLLLCQPPSNVFHSSEGGITQVLHSLFRCPYRPGSPHSPSRWVVRAVLSVCFCPFSQRKRPFEWDKYNTVHRKRKEKFWFFSKFITREHPGGGFFRRSRQFPHLLWGFLRALWGFPAFSFRNCKRAGFSLGSAPSKTWSKRIRRAAPMAGPR